MSGMELSDGDGRGLHSPPKEFKFLGRASHMEMYKTTLSGEHPAYPSVRGDLDKLLQSGLGRAVVGDSHLSHPDHLRDENQIPADGAGEGDRGHPVRAGVDVGGEALEGKTGPWPKGFLGAG